MIIDSHQHVFWHGRDDRGLVADMDEHGIEKAWLLSWEISPFEDNAAYHGVLNPAHLRADGTHAGIPLGDLIAARDRHPGRFILGYCPHPLLGDAPALLRAAAAIHGVKVCGEWKFRIPFDDPRCLELFRAAGELGMPVVLHLDVPYLPGSNGKPIYQKEWYGGTVDNLERALRACPETIFIGHAPGFWREISGGAEKEGEMYPKTPIKPGGRLVKLLESYPNLYADLSAGSALIALERDPSFSKRLLTTFDDRFLFARDYYGGELHAFLSSLELPRGAVEKIYRQNADRLVPECNSNAGTAPVKKLS